MILIVWLNMPDVGSDRAACALNARTPFSWGTLLSDK